MSDFPWSDEIWRPSAASRAATRDGDTYAVTAAVAPASALDRAWHTLSQQLTVDGSALLEGGAALVRLGPDRVEVVSGGEDGLDSLSWSINHTLRAAVLAADSAARITVCAEGEPTDSADNC